VAMMQGVNKREREVYLFALLRKDFASKRSAVTSHGVTNVVDTVYDAGMPMEEVDSSGNITAARKYDVYGLVRSGQVGSSSQKYVGSLGHESEGNTGLIYMRARYMDPVLGRFISEDPSKDGVNWFVYCGDSPTTMVDESGQVPLLIANLMGWVGFGFVWVGAGLALDDIEIAMGFRAGATNKIASAVGAGNDAVGFMAVGMWLLTGALLGRTSATLDTANWVISGAGTLTAFLPYARSFVNTLKSVKWFKIGILTVAVLGLCMQAALDVAALVAIDINALPPMTSSEV
jgi:RHS repeat-associated protein